MSNVLERFRGVSQMEFYHNADVLRQDITRFLMSEKNVPKRWRSIFTYPLINMIEEMFDCMCDANGIVAYTDELVEERKRLQQECIKYCEKIYSRLQYAITVIWFDALHRPPEDKDRIRIEAFIERAGKSLDYEEKLLKGWKKSTKLVQRK